MKKATFLKFSIITFSFLLISCGGVRQLSFYTLSTPETQTTNGSAYTESPFVIGLQKLDGGVLYTDDRIIFRENEFEIKYWHYHRWVAAPNALATDALRDFLIKRKTFADVVTFPSADRVSYVISGRLLAFEEVDINGEWFGKAAVQLTLKEPGQEAVIWKGAFEQLTKVELKQPESVVAAVNASLHKCFEAAVAELKPALNQHSPQPNG